jgi:hypothetical protein
MKTQVVWSIFLFATLFAAAQVAYGQAAEHERLKVTIYAHREYGNDGDDHHQPGTDIHHDHNTGSDEAQSNTNSNVNTHPNYPAGRFRRGALASEAGREWEAQFREKLQENTVRVGTYTLKSAGDYIDVGDGDKIRLPSLNYRAEGAKAFLDRVATLGSYMYTLTIVSGRDVGRRNKVAEAINKAKALFLPEALQAASEGLGMGTAGPLESQTYEDFTESGKFVTVIIIYTDNDNR